MYATCMKSCADIKDGNAYGMRSTFIKYVAFTGFVSPVTPHVVKHGPVLFPEQDLKLKSREKR